MDNGENKIVDGNFNLTSAVNGFTLFRFAALARYTEVRHAVFSRKGGFSRGSYAGLNASFGVGDNPEHVRSNRRAIADYFDQQQVTFSRQVHGTDVLAFTADSRPFKKNGYYTGDALVTDRKNRFLTIQVADCQPVFLYDPVNHAIANIHAGWRGSIQDIIARTIAGMQHHFQTSPADLISGIGPSLGPCCAEFVNYKEEIPPRFWKYGDHRRHFDFWAISGDQLRAAGVKGDNIHISGICTRCRTDLFFSYRGEGTTGRFAAVIGMV